MLLTPQLCTSASYRASEHTNRIALVVTTTAMSLPALLSLAQLKRLTNFVAGQDGSQTQKELLPLMCAQLSIRGGLPPTEKSVGEAIQAIQLRVRHRLETKRRREAEETSAAQQAVQAASARSTRRNTTQAVAQRSSTSRARTAAKKAAATPQTRAEDKLHAALAELRERSVQYTAAQKEKAAEQRKQQAADRKADRQQKKADEAAERKAERDRLVKQRADERELKEKMRDQRALQSLTAAARQRMYEEKQLAALDRQERIDGKFEHLLELETEALEAQLGPKRARRAVSAESEEDKENVEPDGEWSV